MLKTIALALLGGAFLLGCQGNKETPLHGTSTRHAAAPAGEPNTSLAKIAVANA